MTKQNEFSSLIYSLYNLEYPYCILTWAVVGATLKHYDLESVGRARLSKKRIKKRLVAPQTDCTYFRSTEHLFDVCKKRELVKVAQAKVDIARAEYEIESLEELEREHAATN